MNCTQITNEGMEGAASLSLDFLEVCAYAYDAHSGFEGICCMLALVNTKSTTATLFQALTPMFVEHRSPTSYCQYLRVSAVGSMFDVE